MRNWCEFFASRARRIAGKEIEVYSNIEPNRDFEGIPTIEFAETETETRTFISGKTQRERKCSVMCRASEQTKADAIRDGLYEWLETKLAFLKETSEIYGYAIEEAGTLGDVRGINTGESFYGYIEFTIIEKE